MTWLKQCEKRPAVSGKDIMRKMGFISQCVQRLSITLTAPITVESNERSFSRLRLVKNYLRSTMNENRLDDLMIMTYESDVAGFLDVISTVKNS